MSITAPIRVADLSTAAPTPFDIAPSPKDLRALAAELGLDGLRKVRFAGQIAAEGKRDWVLTGQLGATVVQPCVVTLAPVTTRIDTPVRRFYLASFQDPAADEVEMPEDDSLEPLGPEIDPAAVLIEALALALPLYPRAEGADLGAAVFTEPGKQALSDDDTKPFAALAALRGKTPDTE